MNTPVLGIHHVTAIIGQPQPNIDFYTGALGLRMIKLTVNYDDPETYHLYFGDTAGTPGTAITFFPWPYAQRAQPGVGQVLSTAYAVPNGSIEYWLKRLSKRSVSSQRAERMGEQMLTIRDPDDLQIELVETDQLPDVQPWLDGGVPREHAIHGFHSVTLAVAQHQPTNDFLRDVFAFRRVSEEADVVRFETNQGGPGGFVQVQARPDLPRGEMGPGTVHHVAWRVTDDDAQAYWRNTVIKAGRHVTPVKDRNYFHSIYFREPGGVIFEMATDCPGMMVDENINALGTQLKLPPFLEDQRDQIVSKLPSITLPVRL